MEVDFVQFAPPDLFLPPPSPISPHLLQLVQDPLLVVEYHLMINPIFVLKHYLVIHHLLVLVLYLVQFPHDLHLLQFYFILLL